MKRITFSRQSILRAIHAACVALFLLAAASEAEAQTFTAPFTNVSGTTYDTQTGTFTTGGFSGTNNSYSVTINSGTTLNTTSSSYGSGGQFYNAKTNIAVVGGSFTNHGTATQTLTGLGGGFYSDVALYGSSTGDFTAANTGTLTISASGAAAAGLSYDNSNFNANTPAVSAHSLTLTNSGTISGSASGYGFGVHVKSVGTGSVTITNQQGGTIDGTSSGNYAAGIWGHFAGSGGLTVDNAGTVSAVGLRRTTGIDALTVSGAITVTNEATGQITLNTTTSTQQNAGVYARSTSGTIDITNDGLLSVAANAPNAFGILATTTSATDLLAANTGTITVSSSSSGATGVDITNFGTGNVVVTSSASGAISATGSGATSIFASASTGDQIVTNNSTLHATATGSGSAYGISAGGSSSQIINTGAIVSSANTGSSYGISTGTQAGNISIANSNSIHATSTGGTASAIYTYTSTGTETVANTGAITVSAEQTGIGVSGKGNAAAITNSGRVTINSSAGAYGIYTVTTNNSTITNRASGAVSTTSSAYYAFSIYGYSSAGTVQITNAAAVQATSTNGSYGIYVNAAAGANVSNTQTITSTNTGSGYADGIFANSPNGDVTLTNSAAITATASGNSASGLYAKALNGNVTVNNSGHVVALSQTGSYTTSGIYVVAGSGTTSVTNSGYAGGFTEGGTGYGIYIDPTGPIVVNNTGTAKGSLAGIFLASAGTVNNSGLASGSYSIDVPTGSTVNLRGASPVQGLLKGGADASSTSTLNFDIVIRGNFNAQKTSLDNAITAYGLAYTAASGVGDVDSSVVVLNGIDYQWEDFLNVADNLIQGRLYEQTPGYRGIGGAIDSLNLGSTRGAAILNALDNLPDSGVAGALAELSPQTLQVLRHIAFDGASFTATNVNNHLANQRDGLTGFDTSGFSVNTPGVDPTLTQMRSRLFAWNPTPEASDLLSDSSVPALGGIDLKDPKAMVNTQPVDPWSSFISGSVILADVDNTMSNIGDGNYTTGSVLAGADYRLDDHFTVGALFDYSHTSATLDGNGSKATVDSYAPGIYASYVDKGWYGNAMLMYGFNNNSEDRKITIPGIQGTNHGNADGGQVTSNFTGGYEFKKGNFKFGPVASLQYVHLNVGSFQEDGPTSLSIDRQDADSLRSQIGFEVRYSTQSHTPYGLMTFTPHLQASWQHEYMDNSDGINSQFNSGAGGGSFVTQGQQPERDSAFLDLGLDTEIAKNVTVFVDYQTQAGQNDFSAQSAQGGVRVGF